MATEPERAAGHRPRVLSGIQPSGDFHLGNYIGAVRHWVADQDRNDCFYLVVDLHAITLPQDPAELRERTVELAAILLAAGIDPGRSTLFLQSHVHEHAELAWVLQCVATTGELSRMTQFKDKTAKGQASSSTAGLFTYPVLQAADILLYNIDFVPVGEDQRQHLELTRDIAQRFNSRYGETFVMPEATIPPVGAKIMDLQEPEAKMSKSADSPQGTIAALDPPEAIAKKVRSAVTDSGREVVAGEDKPAITNLLTIYSIVAERSIEDLQNQYAGGGYAPFKADLADALVAYLEPFQQRYHELKADLAEIERLLRIGSSKAQEVAATTKALAFDRVGFLPQAGG
ncbi:MAG TPA: tryptophan--tRNA ligase [Actinomycetota bacterium]|nr:tryptophan--tRNA ligase [Actinomycetota bacterium]